MQGNTELAAYQAATAHKSIWRGDSGPDPGRKLSLHSPVQWPFNLATLEVSTGSSQSVEEQSLACSSSADEERTAPCDDVEPFALVNHAAISWHETRKKWIGEQPKMLRRPPRDPVISWSTSYEDLLSTDEPFPEPIPLPEMVDFLVDIWYDEGLFD